MPGASPDPDTSPAVEDGLPAPSRATLLTKFQTYLQARAELFSIESKEAVRVVGRQGALGLCLVGAAFFAYALFLVAAVSLLGGWLSSRWPRAFEHVGWEVAALGAGLLHVVAAAILITLLRRKGDPPLFEYTRAEFHKDREWLQNDQSGNESDS